MKLSIVVTNYNYAQFLEEAITSLFQNQRTNDFEVVLVDDGSTDGSQQLIERLSTRFSLRTFFHEKNQGQDVALMTAFQHIRGEYLHPFASDDIMLAGSIDTMLAFFERYPDISAFCSDNAYFYTDPITDKLLPISEFQYFNSKQVYDLFARTRFWIPGHTIFAKKESFFRCLPYEKKLTAILDWWVNHRLAVSEGIGYIPKSLVLQRKHNASFSAAPSREKQRQSWLHLLSLLEKNPKELRPLYRSGVFRMFGLRSIYKTLLATPRYWKYLFPMLRKMIQEKFS